MTTKQLAAEARAESRSYFKTLGVHIALLRKARGLTQAELARSIGVSQQAVFAYELGERRPSVLIVTKMSRVFAVPIEQVIGLARPVSPKKRKFSPRAMRHAERIQGLSKTRQRFVVRIIDLLEDDRP